MPEIVQPVAVQTEPAKRKRGRPAKAKADPKPRGVGVIEAAFGERGRIASRILPPEQRRALESALRHKGADTTALQSKITKLQNKLASIQCAAETVENFRVKLQSVVDTMTGEDAK